MNRIEADRIEQRFAALEDRMDRLEFGETDTADDDAPPTADELEQETRAELDAIAANVGVDNPSGLPNKRAVAEAIVEARP